jgi:multiple sugar transport system permease protein
VDQAFSMSARRLRGAVAIKMLLLLLGLVLVAVPYVWIGLTAFKRPVDAASVPPQILSPTTLKNFAGLLDSQYLTSLGNSVIVTLLTAACTLVLGVPAGYAFARGRFPGRNFLAGWLLFSRMVPPVIFIIPLFLFFHQLGLINSFAGLTLAYMTGLLPFTIWMSASYFADIPVDLEEAARVDGCTRFQAFIWTALPLALPGVATVANLIAIAAWGEYFVPLILAGPDTTPATVGLVNFVGYDTINWGAMAAAALTLVIPVFLLTLAAQRGLLRGLTAGAVKG